MISAREALTRLEDGNRRYVSGVQRHDPGSRESRRNQLQRGQEPIAIILGCSDSRVPPEIVFDQDLGDLFVIRVAGNVAAPSQIGSVEFAAEQFGTRLVVVLGHSHCGAITAGLESLRDGTLNPSKNLLSIVERVRPAIEGLLDTELAENADALVEGAVRANVSATADRLRRESEVLEPLLRHDGLVVVGAAYSFETGVVDFFDGVEEVG